MDNSQRSSERFCRAANKPACRHGAGAAVSCLQEAFMTLEPRRLTRSIGEKLQQQQRLPWDKMAPLTRVLLALEDSALDLKGSTSSLFRHLWNGFFCSAGTHGSRKLLYYISSSCVWSPQTQYYSWITSPVHEWEPILNLSSFSTHWTITALKNLWRFMLCGFWQWVASILGGNVKIQCQWDCFVCGFMSPSWAE